MHKPLLRPLLPLIVALALWMVSGRTTGGADTSAGGLPASPSSGFRAATAPALAPSCAVGFERRSLNGPYQRHNGQARYTLSAEELEAYMKVMGIELLCIPFATDSEYDTFATVRDRDALRDGTMPDMIDVNGVQGFIRFKPSDVSFGKRTLYKSYVFPFEAHYVAVVYSLGDYDADTDWDALIADLQRGAYPPERQAAVALVDALAMSLRFVSPPKPVVAS